MWNGTLRRGEAAEFGGIGRQRQEFAGSPCQDGLAKSHLSWLHL